MNAPVLIEKLNTYSDARGYVNEPVNAEQLATMRNVHLVWTEPGQVRGNHYHTRSSEIAVVIGQALIRYREAGQVKDVEVPEGEAWQFQFPPHVPHAMKNTGSKPMVMLGFNTAVHDRQNPDTHREVLI